MQWEEGAGNISQLHIWALLDPRLAHLQPGTNTVSRRKSVGPALLHPRSSLSHREWGVIPGPGVKLPSSSCFEPKTITQKHPQPGETSLGVREMVGAGVGGLILLPQDQWIGVIDSKCTGKAGFGTHRYHPSLMRLRSCCGVFSTGGRQNPPRLGRIEQRWRFQHIPNQT